MRKAPHIRIKTDGIMNTQLFVDDKELKGVAGIRFSQSYKENSGAPVLQIDMKATNIELDAKWLPTLPEPFNHHYISVNRLLESETISKEEKVRLCGELGIELETT